MGDREDGEGTVDKESIEDMQGRHAWHAQKKDLEGKKNMEDRGQGRQNMHRTQGRY